MLLRSGAGLTFTELIRDIYANSSTKILSDGGLSRDIPVQSGVKQGCPISGLLFNLCIDPIIRGVQSNNTSHRILAFADDLCLLANSAEELQLSLSFVNAGLKRLGLSLNLAKSVALQVSGKQPVGVRNSHLFIDNNMIRNIAEGEFHKFLGKPVGFNPCPDYKHLSELAEIATLILESSLAPWQRIAELKTFFFPALQFPMRNSQFDKTKWAEIDILIRPEIKNTLGLPERACNDYLYASMKVGAIGIPIAAEDADIHRVGLVWFGLEFYGARAMLLAILRQELCLICTMPKQFLYR
ncbi:Retrovirus-related Pol polyprotein from type-1 retrotransposable element R2 [Araneus ventricosus]|uniref:Retrovirus-related Pol polyprotein from type-1 retrotransposable element R2 n=1 Tax=Araneus ventricosus TaxID=182803 RepID=A0A4Y2KXZ3_ARAVE|nr:Retrovirus-related Pol polyprotein from type-1 retrotransposable element R2 [Araneus ventricosus]